MRKSRGGCDAWVDMTSFPFTWSLNVERVSRDLLASLRVENHILPKGFRYIFKQEPSFFFFFFLKSCKRVGLRTGAVILTRENGHEVAEGVPLHMPPNYPQKSSTPNVGVLL